MEPAPPVTGLRLKAIRLAAVSGTVLSQFLSPFALAQSASPVAMNADMVMDTAPLVVGVGALIFGMIAVVWGLRARRRSARNQEQAQNQIARMRANLDSYEAALSCMPEVSILWRHSDPPQMFGRTEILGARNMALAGVLDFGNWLAPPDAARLDVAVRDLLSGGQNFSIRLKTLSGFILQAQGEAAGETAVVRLYSPVRADTADSSSGNGLQQAAGTPFIAHQVIHELLSALKFPAWVRDQNDTIVFANRPYLDLAARLGIPARKDNPFPEIFPVHEKRAREQFGKENARTARIRIDRKEVGGHEAATGDRELVLCRLAGGVTGFLFDLDQHDAAGTSLREEAGSFDIARMMDAVTSPMAVFDGDARLKQFNGAYRALFGFDENWLVPGLHEREIIDHLRREGKLPAVADYRKWRSEHLKSYGLKETRNEIWNLPDGRTLKVTATPETGAGGVIYAFEDISEQLKLQSANNEMLYVQRETINALNEAVAVFSTDGRLRLHNPRLSSIWKLPMNQLGSTPHIDRIAQACGKAIPEDGEEIWQRLKRAVIDLDPARVDQNGRIRRRDGTLIDYAIVRLPDGQTMLTFNDVTKSANYENILRERNEALVTADRLKDAFVQNVSYELRSPLTSIIGFADLLASDNLGPLTEQQRAYANYIRASSASLGTLIDGILDLTNVNAGIARLELDELDIASLIRQAEAGFAATLVGAQGARALDLDVVLPDPLPRFVADGNRIVQILYNLLSNAAKFSEPGSRVRLVVQDNGEWIRFIVEDEGVGLTREIQDALARDSQATALKGLQREAGIGLSIVKAFVELHGGTLSMQANEPRGTRVIVNLPADASARLGQDASTRA